MSPGNDLHILILVSVLSVNLAMCTVLYSNTWVAQIEGGREEAERIALERDLTLLGQVGSLEGFYMFKHNTHPRRSKRSAEDITADLSDHPSVIWADQQIVKSRVKRYNPNLNDPDFSKQWFIQNTAPGFRGYDHNILPVWEQGVTGKGVVVSILDDGIEYTHKDLQANYAPRGSYDFNSNDNDPAPRATFSDENRHGTRCAGEVAAVANNSLCGVGVAPKARVGGVRMLDGDVTDAVEAASLSLNPQDIDVYSSSWGPDDDGQTVDGPARLARKAFADGVQKGRGGLGSIYVWASGNGGKSGDSCSCDGYTNSIYTLSISSATEHGTSPWYSEYCASTLASTFSSGSMGMRKIVTTDLHGRCTESHTGTSASAPLAAGILALALDVNHNLTWRDMQHLVVRTSTTKKLSSSDFVTNAVGRKVSHEFGYGLLDALALVELARKWKTVPTQHACRKIPEVQKRPIPGSGSLKVTVETTGCANNATHVRYLEHVKVVITLSFSRRGDLSIKLTSPSGTPATLLPTRGRDYSPSGFKEWEFMSVHTWGENPKGTWTLEIKNHGSTSNTGSLSNWYLVMYGTSDPVEEDSSVKEPVPACNVECQNGCTGPQADQCKECKHFRSSLDNRCVAHCSQTEYEDSVEKRCKSCCRTCATCGGPSAKDCLSCYSPLLLNNGSCVNFCPAGLYKFQKDSKTQGVCLKCDEPCLTCAGSAAACTSCSPAYKHVVSSCVSRCGDGQYPEADGQCKPCHPSCLTCNNGSAHSCTKCRSKDGIHGSFLHSGECVPSCPQGFFGHAASQECHLCHSSCSECTGPSSTDCSSCTEGLNRLGIPTGACIAECPEGHYVESSNRTCLPCQSLCKQCDQADPHKCTSCRMDTFLDKHRCVSSSECSNGTYANSKTRKCENCTTGCTSCHGSSETQCLTCAEGYHMYKSQCLLHCPQGTFPNSSASCSPCDASCQTCFGESDKQCLTCTTAKILLGSHCVSSCPSGWFHNQASHHCEECSPICKSCRGPSDNNCLSCKAGWKLIGSTCKSSCPSGMVESGDECRECHSSCFTCQGPTDKDCLTCSGVKFLDPITNTCSYECPEGFHGDLDTTHCKPCSPGCSKCKNSAECISCRPGLLLEGNSCQIQCQQGFYRSIASSCEPCDGTCEECFSSPTHCTRCRAPDVLNNRKCIGVCPAGMYVLKDTKRCAPCHSSCKLCKGPGADDCTECSASAVMVDRQCMQSCPQGYYLDKEVNRCQRCGYYCASCDGGNGIQNCTKCIAPFVSYKHYCVRACPKHGWVLDTDLQTCVRCHSSCERCIGPAANNCTACAEADMNLVGFTCQGNCPSDLFPNHLTGMCERCHPTCKTCTGPGAADCQTCAKDLARNANSGMCSSVCPQGLFSVRSRCQECHPNCKSCNGPGSVSCLSCHSGKFFYKNTCVQDCPEWTYSVNNDGIQQCRQCHPLCQSCNGPSVDSCIQCRSPLLLEGRLCVMQCAPNYSIHESTRSCQPCGNNCRVQTRNKNRSVQSPSATALQFVLQDPHKGGVSMIAIAAASCSVIIFLIVFGVLQLRSKRRVRYMIIKASFRKSEDEDTEDRVSLIDNEEDTA